MNNSTSLTYNELTKTEQLIYHLIFTNIKYYELDLSDYIKITSRTEFREEIRNIVNRINKKITEDRIIHKDDKTIWKIQIE